MEIRYFRPVQLLVITTFLAFAAISIPAPAAESYSSWKKERIIEISVKFIADTKAEFARRAAAIKEETGEVVELDYQVLHEPEGDEKKMYERFVAAKLGATESAGIIKKIMVDLERIRKKLAKAEEAAFESWAKKPVEKPQGRNCSKRKRRSSVRRSSRAGWAQFSTTRPA